MEKTIVKKEIEKNIEKNLRAELSSIHLSSNERMQVIMAWELKRIADVLEKIADCEYKGGLVILDGGKV